jgi:hypothetical protein
MTGHYTASPADFDSSPVLAAEKKPDTYADVFKEYLSTSTILGVNFLYQSPYLFQRCMWVVVMFAGMCATGYHSYTCSYVQLSNQFFLIFFKVNFHKHDFANDFDLV